MDDAGVPSVVADRSEDGVVVKISMPQLEINVWIPQEELSNLEQVRTTLWDKGSLRIGRSAGEAAWWSADLQEQTLSIVIGHDDETWDVGAILPLATLDLILTEVERC